MGLSIPFYSGIQTALLQEKIKPEYLGRVFSLTGSIMSLAIPLGLILSGAFADKIGVNRWFLLSKDIVNPFKRSLCVLGVITEAMITYGIRPKK